MKREHKLVLLTMWGSGLGFFAFLVSLFEPNIEMAICMLSMSVLLGFSSYVHLRKNQ